jgi:hypothetical protein
MSNKYLRHISAADRRARAIISACVASGAGIEFLPDAPRFRYDPASGSTQRTLYHGPPSSRGSVPCGKNRHGLKNWSPSKLDASPQYNLAMRGDPPELTEAREAWHQGNPIPLRVYLAEEAKARREAREALFGEPAATQQRLFG